MAKVVNLREYGILASQVIYNASPARLYEDALAFDGDQITSTGALATRSAEKTGRSPRDKRIVRNPESERDVWWGPVNMEIKPESFRASRRRAVEYLSGQPRVYVVDGFAGWDPRYRIKVRVVCSRPYHALFMHNMLIRPSAQELQQFGQPDYVVFNAGAHPADPSTPQVNSQTNVSLDFETGEFVILGTQYAGEMKKGVFTIMHYLMPKRGVLSMHCSANEGQAGDVTLFFGLSGTGKTTLSADPRRQLIGDDEHCWSDHGIFNIEGGCYAKCIHLSPENEPEIFQAIRFGTVLENTVHDPLTREVDFSNSSLTENTRAAYPIEFIQNAKLPCVGGHPDNIILLTCDAFGVLPPVSRLTPEQAMYHFINGYTAKVAGTEVGITEPQATFSACFGAAFLVWHPTRYAEMLAERMRRHASRAWLVNTGWTGGAYGVGRRMKLAHTRAIIDAIHDGSLAEAPTTEDAVFGLHVPLACAGCPSELLLPENAWDDRRAYDETATRLARLFHDNFAQYADQASDEIRSAGPTVCVTS
ncbi:MAG: phosphoenolpyruvate carboxykinase (ATP) [Pirellulaceae bacterium]|nr:phosphoenolpyruvate carboxykinase (ATP) [Pirellulaceae bacterium]